ncbi:MAG: triphosphoribosyl-dephospho-CoA synthase [Halobacteriota archaeon]
MIDLEPTADRSPAANAQLAMLLEVAGTPKPGNVDRRRDLEGLRFEHFLAGAVRSGPGLRMAQAGEPIGTAFERSVAGMSDQRGGNTQFGSLLLLVPLVAASARNALDPDGAAAIVRETTVDDAIGFYRAFEHVDVAVGDPPTDAQALDVRRGAAAAETLTERELTLFDVMELSAEPAGDRPADGNAREWLEGFPRTFRTAERILTDEGSILDRTARAFLELLAEEVDTLVAIKHDRETAEYVRDRARTVGRDLAAAEQLAAEFVAAEINPGTTADVTAAGLFVALERGVNV